jgi:Cu-Zn family superoxide dismutase
MRAFLGSGKRPEKLVSIPFETNIVTAPSQTKDRLMRPLAALVFAALAVGCDRTPASPELAEAPQPQTLEIVGANGQPVGDATFTEAPNGVLIRMDFSDGSLSEGWHGLHLHHTGDCSDFAAGFQASGAHVASGRQAQHGLLNPSGPEAGDLPNIYAPASGRFGAEVFSPYVTLRGAPVGDRQPLLDADGAALLIHAAADDHASQPIGNAGARIACAALTPSP